MIPVQPIITWFKSLDSNQHHHQHHHHQILKNKTQRITLGTLQQPKIEKKRVLVDLAGPPPTQESVTHAQTHTKTE